MDIIAFRPELIAPSAALFVENFRRQRRANPLLPTHMENHDGICARIEEWASFCPGVAAVQDGELLGYMLWVEPDQFRGADRKGAYVAEWAHGAVPGMKNKIYRSLYREASSQWTAHGCGVHAISLLASDEEALQTWFWSGFGLTVVDALRSITPLYAPAPAGLHIRKATPADANRLADIEAEHWRHYAAPPVYMRPQAPDDAAAFTTFLENSENGVWLALDDDITAGYMRFEGASEGAADVVADDATIACTGAYVRPAYRGRRISPALLDAALIDFSTRGYQRCAVDFESINPEASAFWMTHFKAVCYSLLRVPEVLA